MSPLLAPRALFLAMALASAGLMAFALYLEYVYLLDPCPLCMMQRIWVVIVGLLALGAALHGQGLARWGLATGGAAIIGSGFSLRQLWLQSLPADEVPACGPGLDYMLEVFPLSDVLKAMVMGTGNCAEVTWTFLSFSIPAWVLVAFAGFLAISLFARQRAAAPPQPWA
jgi:protein dithiol:quinone oxidoreductase